MKTIRVVGLLLIAVAFIGCSKKEEKTEQEDKPNTYAISQSLQEVNELDEVTFSLNNQSYVNSVKWFLNDLQVGTNSSWSNKFYTSGTFTLKAVVEHGVSPNSLAVTTSILQKEITINESPKYRVHIKKIEVLSYSSFNNFSNGNSKYLKSYFEIIEKDPLNVSINNPTHLVKYISPENSANHGVQSFQPMIWDIAAANYKVWVYKTGNNYPNRHFVYTTEIKLYGRYSAVSSSAFNLLNTFKPALNTYRDLRPETMIFNNEGTQYRLTVEWEDYL